MAQPVPAAQAAQRPARRRRARRIRADPADARTRTLGIDRGQRCRIRRLERAIAAPPQFRRRFRAPPAGLAAAAPHARVAAPARRDLAASCRIARRGEAARAACRAVRARSHGTTRPAESAAAPSGELAGCRRGRCNADAGPGCCIPSGRARTRSRHGGQHAVPPAATDRSLCHHDLAGSSGGRRACEGSGNGRGCLCGGCPRCRSGSGQCARHGDN